MPPIRIPPSKVQKTERTHEENQERAYIAASRRSDRSLEARVESARRASEIHKKRTGRGLRVTEQDVINEEMYEEEEDDMPSRYRQYLLNSSLQTNSPVFNDRLIAYLAANAGIRNQVASALTSANQMNNVSQMYNIDPYGFNQSMYPSPMPGLQGFQGQQQQTMQQQQMIMQQQQQQMQRPVQQQMQQSSPYHRHAPYPPSRGMQHSHQHQHQRSSSIHIPAEQSASSNVSSPATITDRRMSMPIVSTPSSSTPRPAAMTRPSFAQGTFAQMSIQQHRPTPDVPNTQTPSLIGTPDIYPLTTQPPQNFNDFFAWDNNAMMGGPVPNTGFQSSQTVDLKDQNIRLPQTSDSNGANVGLNSTLGSQHPHSNQLTPTFKFEDNVNANGHDYFADDQAGSDVAVNWDNFINDDTFAAEDTFAVIPSGSQ